MKKIYLLFAFIALTFNGLHAGPVDQQKAQQLGARFLSATAIAQRGSEIQLNLVSVATDLSRGGADYYVFNVVGGEGFVIVAGDDCVKPILAYSTTGSYNPSDVAEGFAFTLSSFQQEIQFMRENNLSATPDIVAEWKSVMSTGELQKGRLPRSVVGPLCQTTWHQNYPYNSQCPEDPEGNGGHVYAGCVATAMAQVMKYWEWPNQGNGSYSYTPLTSYFEPSGYPVQTANFGETDYHFELMPNSIDSTNTEEDYFYIAQLLHHCGISVDMMYGPDGSGAYSISVPEAMYNYFRYNSDYPVDKDSWWGTGYTNEQWIFMLKNRGLDQGLPLYYSASDDGGAGGHAFVCDGYDENDYFHFNWGWSGRDDAWCPIGALNTTKYAFNTNNSFIGHIIPESSDYYLRADSVVDFVALENEDRSGVLLSWNNPSLNLQGGSLTSIDSICIRRNNQPLVTLTDVQVGAAGSYFDGGLEPGLYEYAISVVNASGVGHTVYRKLLVGEKCDVIFELHDEGGNGWKGAAISVTDENGQRIAVIGMTEGSDTTVTVPLLKQQLNFIWNHGWYYGQEQYETDSECSFVIKNFEGDELYSSSTLEDGVFLTYENNCEFVPLACYPVQNFQGEYLWNNDEEFGAKLTWDAPYITSNLDHFNIHSDVALKEDIVVPYTGAASYEYVDLVDFAGVCVYSVTSVYVRGDETCESEDVSLDVVITDLGETISNVNVYPNPTSGIVNINSQGKARIIVSNYLGQKLVETDSEGNTSIDLSRFGQGIYFLRVETTKGGMVKKISVRK